MSEKKQPVVGKIKRLTGGTEPIDPPMAYMVGEMKPMESTVLHLTAAPHSVEVSRNASGGVSVSVKCYGATPEEAAQRARALFAELDAEYPVKSKGA